MYLIIVNLNRNIMQTKGAFGAEPRTEKFPFIANGAKQKYNFQCKQLLKNQILCSLHL